MEPGINAIQSYLSERLGQDRCSRSRSEERLEVSVAISDLLFESLGSRRRQPDESCVSGLADVRLGRDEGRTKLMLSEIDTLRGEVQPGRLAVGCIRFSALVQATPELVYAVIARSIPAISDVSVPVNTTDTSHAV